jgi:hypothetical protein
MRLRYQQGCLRCIRRKSGPDCWEFLWRENDVAGKRVRRTAIIGTIEQYPTRDLAQEAVNGLRMQVNEDRNRQPGYLILLGLFVLRRVSASVLILASRAPLLILYS